MINPYYSLRDLESLLIETRWIEGPNLIQKELKKAMSTRCLE